MTNLSLLTRKEQVLERLQLAQGGWVDGPLLATEMVGGSEGLRRLRELKEDGYQIERRKHPDPTKAIFQYRLGTWMKKAASPSDEHGTPRHAALPPAGRRGAGQDPDALGKLDQRAAPRASSSGVSQRTYEPADPEALVSAWRDDGDGGGEPDDGGEYVRRIKEVVR